MSEEIRVEVVHKLVLNTLTAISNSTRIAEIIVVSQDEGLLDVARQFRVRTIKEPGQPELNKAIDLGTKSAMENQADSLMIMPIDLPLVTSKDIDDVISLSEYPSEMIIAPDRHYTGTNLLIIRPPGIVRYKFGNNSFSKHLGQAKINKMVVKVVDRKPWNLDLDLPEDFKILGEFKNPLGKSIMAKIQ